MRYTHSLCKGPGVESHPHVGYMMLWLNLVLGAWGKGRLPLSGLLGFDVGDPRTMQDWSPHEGYLVDGVFWTGRINMCCCAEVSFWLCGPKDKVT